MIKTGTINMKSRFKFLYCHPHSAVMLDPNFTTTTLTLDNIQLDGDNRVSRLLNFYKQMPHATSHLIDQLKLKTRIIINPYKNNEHPDVAFRIERSRGCLSKTIKYLEINNDGAIQLLNDSFLPCNEKLTNYLFTTQAKKRIHQLTSNPLYDIDQNNRFGITYRLQYKFIDNNSPFLKIFIMITKEGELHYDAYLKNDIYKSNKIEAVMIPAILNHTVLLEKYIMSDLQHPFSRV